MMKIQDGVRFQPLIDQEEETISSPSVLVSDLQLLILFIPLSSRRTLVSHPSAATYLEARAYTTTPRKFFYLSMRPARFQYLLIAPTSSPSSGWDQSCLKNLNHLWRTCVKEYNPSSRSYAALFFKLKCICRKRGFSVIRRWLEDVYSKAIGFFPHTCLSAPEFSGSGWRFALGMEH